MNAQESATLSSPANPRIRAVARLRQRSHRDEADRMLIEGYREIRRAIDNRHFPRELYVCRELFLGANEEQIVADCRAAGTEIIDCSPRAFEKIAYRDRPEGLLAVAPQLHLTLDDIPPADRPLIVVAEAIEKPGNLGTILRSADAAGVHAVIVCDRCTDINNPNVVRASIGTLFSVPVIETTSPAALQWLASRNIRTLAASPHADRLYTEVDMTTGTAIVVGAEQYGLSESWMQNSGVQVRIPMLGQADSLNVASATTILLYEAVRQRNTAMARPSTVPNNGANSTVTTAV